MKASGFDFPSVSASALVMDLFFALEGDFDFGFAFLVGLNANRVTLNILLSSCCLVIFS